MGKGNIYSRKYIVPPGFVNIGIGNDPILNQAFLVADTNNSENWFTFRQELPPGNWTIRHITFTSEGSCVTIETLVNYRTYLNGKNFKNKSTKGGF